MYKHASVFSIILLLFSLCCRAQFTKGTRMPGVSIASAFFNSGKAEYTAPAPTNGYTSNTNSIGVNLVPSMGWFISSKTVVGARLLTGYQYDKYIDAANDVTFRKKEAKVMKLGLGVFARYYVTESGSFLPYVQLNLDGGSGSSTTEGFNYGTNFKETYKGKSSGDFFANAGLSVGVTRMINDFIGLDISAGYNYMYSKTSFKVNTNRDIDINGSIDEAEVSDVDTKTRNNGFSIGLGIQVFLTGNK